MIDVASGVGGLVLAAGAGRRMGLPKALVSDPDGTSWLVRSAEMLLESGCDDVTVVLGAGADDARPLVPEGVAVVVADDWDEGMGASLRAGLRALAEVSDGDAALVSLVDLPDVGAAVARRLLALASGPTVLARAVFDSRPGHPVLIGRHHWLPVADSVSGDTGAKDYLAEHGCHDVECGDLATGRDQDHPLP